MRRPSCRAAWTLVAIDGSEPSNLALAEAIKLAQALRSSICLFHVLDVRSLLTSEAAEASYDMLFATTRRDGAQMLHAAAMVSRAAIPPSRHPGPGGGGASGRFSDVTHSGWRFGILLAAQDDQQGHQAVVSARVCPSSRSRPIHWAPADCAAAPQTGGRGRLCFLSAGWMYTAGHS